MKIAGSVAIVTGAGSGLGNATALHLVARGATVVGIDLAGREDAIGATGAIPATADITDPVEVAAALDAAPGPVRVLVHCAGVDGAVRVVDKDGVPGSADAFERVVRTNLVGSFVVLSQTAARMAAAEPIDGERGVCILTASIAAFDGQIGQVPYSASKGGVVGMTLPAARDLARRLIRVVAIAPGIFDTPMLQALPHAVREALGESVPHPARLGDPAEFASLAAHVVENPMLNGETIRLDGALRMAPR